MLVVKQIFSNLKLGLAVKRKEKKYINACVYKVFFSQRKGN